VPVKTAEQQATALLHRGREQLVRQRTMLVNALRAHLAEFGMVAAQGLRNVGQLIAIVRADGDTRLPDVARQVLQVLANQIEQIEAAISALERQLLAWHKSNPVSQRLASIEPLAKSAQTIHQRVRRPAVEHPDHRHRGLLCARCERPRCRRAAEQRDEVARSTAAAAAWWSRFSDRRAAAPSAGQ
jgi:transposase